MLRYARRRGKPRQHPVTRSSQLRIQRQQLPFQRLPVVPLLKGAAAIGAQATGFGWIVQQPGHGRGDGVHIAGFHQEAAVRARHHRPGLWRDPDLLQVLTDDVNRELAVHSAPGPAPVLSAVQISRICARFEDLVSRWTDTPAGGHLELPFPASPG